VTPVQTGKSTLPKDRTWKIGVRIRLLLAFLVISTFALLAAAAGIYAFREVGSRLQAIDTRVPPTFTSLELSRSAERIIAAAPTLLAATDRHRRDQAKAELEAEVERLNGKLSELRRERSAALPLEKVEPIVASLTANLAALERLVARRLEANERIKSLLHGVFQTNEELGRLLMPWLMVIEGQIAPIIEDLRRARPGGESGDAARRLAASLRQREPIQAAQQQFSTAADMLAEASTTDQDQRLSVLAFQLGRVLVDLEATTANLDPKLRPLLEAQVAKLRAFVDGPQAITQERKQELMLIREGQKLLAENSSLSAQLVAAVDRLAALAKQDIGDATRDALQVQRVSTRVLVAAVALSLLTSALIVWLYVGRNIVRRLTSLSDGMLAISGGKLDSPVPTHGGDEIAAMARAVEVFRRNAIDLERLLEEREESAARLEKVVEERTGELERRSAVLRVTFDNMGHGVVMFDKDRRMVAWNRRFQELLDLPDERVGASVSFEGFIRHLAERGEYGPCDVDVEVERHLSSVGRTFVDERTRPNGTVLGIRRNPVPSGGFVSIYADVTEERRAQALVELARARLTDAIESLSDGFALWDKDDRLVVFNSRCQELLKAADLFVIGTRFEDLIRAFSGSGRYERSQGADRESWIEERIRLHRNAPGACELRLASGLWLHVREFRTQEGGTVTTWTDITTVKQREHALEVARDTAAESRRTMEEAYRELKVTQANLIHAEKMASLGQVTAGIAHEIKNPLNFVNNFAGLSVELLAELKATLGLATEGQKAEALAEVEELTATLTSNLSKIAEHGRRADGIVQSMLLHSRGNSGERQRADLNTLIEEALNLAFHGARAQDEKFRATLQRDFDPNLASVELVPQDITRVFLNLIGNGFYATRKRAHDPACDPGYHPVLRVSTRDLGRQVEARVRDNGGGIPPEVQAKLFTPFFTTKPAGEGTGLGLSLSYDIVVKQHAGTMEVDTQPGDFTEFRIVLPREPAATARSEPGSAFEGKH